MAPDTLAELRAEVKQLDANWLDLIWQKNELVELEREKRRPQTEARQAAWWAYVGRDTGSAPF